QHNHVHHAAFGQRPCAPCRIPESNSGRPGQTMPATNPTAPTQISANARFLPAFAPNFPCSTMNNNRESAMSDFMTRIVGAAKLVVPIYEEVEADTGAIGQAAGVVALASIAAGIGVLGMGGLGFFIWSIIGALIGWFIWAALTWAIGTKLLPEAQTDADIGQTLRTLGFAASPGLLRILGFIPVLGWIIVLIANIWMLVAMVVAVRQALDYKSTGRAIGVCIIGFIVEMIIMAAII